MKSKVKEVSPPPQFSMGLDLETHDKMVEIENGSSIGCCKESNDLLSSEDMATTTPKVRPARVSGVMSTEYNKLKSSFDELLSVFLKGNCPHDCFKPLPPILGNGHSVDLLKLYSVVKKKGGSEAISNSGLWGEVGLLYGVGPTFGSAIKLVYFKYLGSLEHWLVKLVDINDSGCGEHSEGLSMEPGCAFSRFVYDIVDEMRRNNEDCVSKMMKSDINLIDLTKENNVEKRLNRKKIQMGFAEVVDLTEDNLDDDGKLKRKNSETGFANDVVVTQGNHNVKKLKRNKTNMTVASDVGFTELNNDNSLEKTQNEMSSANFVSPNVSLGPNVADNVIMGSENSNACKKSYTQVEDKSRSVNTVLLKEKVYSDGVVRYCLSNWNDTKLKKAMSEMSFAHDSNVGRSSLGPEGADGIFVSSENSDTSKMSSNHETKQEGLASVLCWIVKISKNPTDSEIGMISESNCWKQALLARESLFLKRNQVSANEQLLWQKKHKMHPSMFDDQIKSPERSSPRLLSIGTPGSYGGRFKQRLVAHLDLQPAAAIYTDPPQQRIPVGRAFQAEIPEWIPGVSAKSDSKWLGSRVWPPEKRLKNKRDLIGKRNVDTNCRCQTPGSTECVKLHISERRTKMKLELGPVFYAWNFDKMGEECSLYWTADEEKKFKAVIKENPISLYRCFGHQMSKVLPRKSWPDQLNYYYNVFVLRRRGVQNRLTSCNIDSDDDETEYRTPSNRSGHLF